MGEKSLQVNQLTRDSSPKFMNTFCSSTPKQQTTPSKQGKKISTDSSQRRHTDGQKTHEKMFSITHPSRHAHQNHHDLPPYTSQMAIIKTSTNSKCWRWGGEKGTLVHSWWDWKLVQPLWKTVGRCLRKLKIELPFDPAIPLLGIYPEKTMTWKYTCTPMFTEALFAIAKTWKQPKCPSTEEWIKKRWYI